MDVLLPHQERHARRVEPHLPRPARPRGAAGLPRHHGRAPRPPPRRHLARGPAVRRDPAGGRHPGGVGPRPGRRLPARPRRPAAAAAVRPRRGARAGDGRAGRAARRRRRRGPGRAGARQAARRPAAVGRSPGAGGPPYGRSGPAPRPVPTGPGDHRGPRRGLRRAPPGPDGLPHRGRQRPAPRGRAVGGGGALRPLVPAVPVDHRRRRPHLPDRPRGVRRDPGGDVRAAGGPRPGRDAGGEPRHRLGSTTSG